MSIPSLKKELINNIANWFLADGAPKKRIVLITSFGVIEGTPAKLSLNDINSKYDDQSVPVMLYKMSEQIEAEYRKTYELDEEAPLDGNDGFITLTDVTLGIVRFNILNVFYDQIVGFTIKSGIFNL